MNKYTKQDIMDLVEEEDVEFIRLQFVDVFGTLKNLAVTTSQLDKVLNNECMFDGAAIDGFKGNNMSELFLKPVGHICNFSMASTTGKGSPLFV